MLEQTRILFLLICIMTLTVFVIQYLNIHTNYMNTWLHKAGNLLSYGWLKACITIGHAKEYARLKLDTIFCRYHNTDAWTKELHQKEQQLSQMKSQMNKPYTTYKKNGEYNLKILK